MVVLPMAYVLVVALSGGLRHAAATYPTCSMSNISHPKIAVTKFSYGPAADICDLHVPPVGLKDMSTMCSEFCSSNGQSQGIMPLLMGSESYGFNEAGFNSFCRGDPSAKASNVFTFDESLFTDCIEKRDSLATIQNAAADFVARVEIFKYEQLLLRGRMEAKMSSLGSKLNSEDFINQMKRKHNRLEILREQFQEFANETEKMSGGNESTLMVALQNLTEADKKLQQVLTEQIDSFNFFISDCNTLLTGLGKQKEYLLDICAVENDQCINSDPGRHAGCCCGINLVAAPDDITGVDGLEKVPEGRILSRRRRKRQIYSSSNVLAQSRIAARPHKLGVRNILKDIGKEAVLTGFELAQKKLYPEYNEHCADAWDRRLATKDVASHEIVRDRINDTRVKKHRLLQQKTLFNCTPPQGKEVVLSQFVNVDVCSNQVPPISDQDMADMCQDFCSPFGMPIQMGSSNFGFDYSEMQNVCLKAKGGILEADYNTLQQCESWGYSFKDIETQTANFLKELEIFTASKLAYSAFMLDFVDQMTREISKKEFKDEMKRAPNKDTVLKKTILDTMSRLKLQHKGLDRMQSSTLALQKAAQDMSLTLRSNIPLVRRFLTECNGLFLAIGPEREYLLDICAQGSSLCINDREGYATARHVGCCCAYNPLQGLGLPKMRISAGYQEEARRLGLFSAVDSAFGGGLNAVDMVAQAWTDAKPIVDNIYGAIEIVGHVPIIGGYVTDMKDLYDTGYCAFKIYQGERPDPGSASHATPTHVPISPCLLLAAVVSAATWGVY